MAFNVICLVSLIIIILKNHHWILSYRKKWLQEENENKDWNIQKKSPWNYFFYYSKFSWGQNSCWYDFSRMNHHFLINVWKIPHSTMLLLSIDPKQLLALSNFFHIICTQHVLFKIKIKHSTFLFCESFPERKLWKFSRKIFFSIFFLLHVLVWVESFDM